MDYFYIVYESHPYESFVCGYFREDELELAVNLANELYEQSVEALKGISKGFRHTVVKVPFGKADCDSTTVVHEIG